MSTQPTHREAAKSAPFASKGVSRSHAARSAMTTSLRKAKRSQMVEMKRHMKLNISSSGGNPYKMTNDHVTETVSMAECIVECCSHEFNNSFAKLSSSLERLCVLISPSELMLQEWEIPNTK
jgi:hypothetical protein